MIYNEGKYNQHWSTKKYLTWVFFQEEFPSIDQEMTKDYLKVVVIRLFKREKLKRPLPHLR